MKISAISYNIGNLYKTYPSSRKEFEETLLPNNFGNVTNLKNMPIIYPITFTSIQNSSKLRILFGYKLPCIYSGVEMIDPKILSKLIKNGFFFNSSKNVMDMLNKFDCFSGMEAKIIEILNQRSKIYPQKNIKELLIEIEPVFRKELYKSQMPVFHELKMVFETLPKEYQDKFSILMNESEKKISKQPLYVPFSSYEFKYKLIKIKETLAHSQNPKVKKVVNKLLKESKRLSPETNGYTLNNQIKTLGMIDWIYKKSVLKDNKQLGELIAISKARLMNKETVIPFSRKSFIYDISKIISPIEDIDLQQKIINIAQKLPTSSQNFSAYVLKCVSEPCDKIGFRIMWPYLASIEHLFPKSLGGEDIMSNFAGATTRENSLRKNIDFTEQLKLRPNTPLYCQKYVDRLIDLYHQKIFEKHRINPKYIEDFRNTILKLSKGSINLDISRMYA